jgi:hypothetical protein
MKYIYEPQEAQEDMVVACYWPYSLICNGQCALDIYCPGDCNFL